MTEREFIENDEVRATPRETLEDLLGRSRRTKVPVRRTFLQVTGLDRVSRPGALQAFVTERRSRALDLYLLLHGGASAEPWDVTQPAMSWARMLSMPQTRSSETTISRYWTWLETDLKLVRTEREKRMRKVFLLSEDGSGAEYTHPRLGTRRGYFNVPFDYFREDWHLTLSLRAKATLMICLAQKPIFTLPTERAALWYGISADTLQRGLDELREHELLKVWMRARKEPRARYGYTNVAHYWVLPPFTVPGDRGNATSDPQVGAMLASTTIEELFAAAEGNPILPAAYTGGAAP